MTQQSQSLAILDNFRALLAKADTLEEVTDLRSKADAIRVWAKSAAMGLEAQNRAAELKLRAERKAGELLKSLKLRGGDRKSNGHGDRLSLRDLGINQSQSKRWQREAAVPEREFERYVEQSNRFGEELTAAGLLRLYRKAARATVEGSERVVAQDDQDRTSPARVIRLRRVEPIRTDQGTKNGTACNLTEQLELIQEISDHHTLLCDLLIPVCSGTIEDLLPIQRQAVRHYLAETGRLLARLDVAQRDGDQHPGELGTYHG